MRRVAARCLLAVALVVAQYGVHAHALSHLEKVRSGHDAGAPVNHAPEVCLAFIAASGGAPPASGLPLHTGAAPDACAAPAPADPFLPSLALTRFASRAPPLPA